MEQKIKSKKLGLSSFYEIIKSCLSLFSKDNVVMISNGMVYTTLMALVPCMALIYSFLHHLGIIEPVIAYIDDFFVKTFGSSTGSSLVEYFDIFMQNAMSLSVISMLSFVVTFLRLIDKLTLMVNRLFHCKVKKNPAIRFLKYMGFMVASMAIIVILVSIYTRFSSWFVFLKDLPELSTMQVVLKKLLPKLSIFLVLFGIVYFIPDTKVNFYAAFIGSAIGFVFILGLEFVFKIIVTYSVKYSVIYGSLATLMFFFMFISWMWRIIFTSVVLTKVLNKSFSSEKLEV